MRIAIVEDRAADSEVLQGYIKRWAEKYQIPLTPPPALFKNGEDFLEDFSAGAYDLVFLDIYMGGISGMETARWLRKSDPFCHLVFTTTSEEFAVESYEVAACWYLLKPYSCEKFMRAMEQCRMDLLERQQSVFVEGEEGENRLFLHEVTWSEHQGRYILVHMRDGQKRKVFMRYGDFSRLLLEYPYFCDCMRGVLVNLEVVEKLMRDQFVLKNGDTVPISRLKDKKVREQFLEYTYSRTRGDVNR